MKKKAWLQLTSQESTMRSKTQRNKALRDIDFQKELRQALSAHGCFLLLEYTFQNTRHVVQFL